MRDNYYDMEVIVVKEYIKPIIEIIDFSLTDTISASRDNESGVPDVGGGGTAGGSVGGDGSFGSFFS